MPVALPVGDHDDDDQQHDNGDDPLQRMPQGRRWISGRRSASGRDGERDQEAGQHKLQAEPEGQRMVTPGAEAGDGRAGRADPGNDDQEQEPGNDGAGGPCRERRSDVGRAPRVRFPVGHRSRFLMQAGLAPGPATSQTIP